jgi:hypothetical protein
MRDFLTIAATFQRQEKEIKESPKTKKKMQEVPRMKRLNFESAACIVVRQLIHHPRYYYR